jgi:lipopolysaccharide export system protein LptA
VKTWIFALGLGLCGTLLALAAATPQITITGGFRVPFFENNRTIALVSGQEAVPTSTAGQMAVTEFRLVTFATETEASRQTNLIIESTTATFHSRGAFSPEPLRIRSADNRFLLQGEGWTWEASSGRLTVSNRIQTTFLLPDRPTNQPPIVLQSQSLLYNLKSGEAIFQDACEAIEADRARVTADRIVAPLHPEARLPHHLAATGNVTLQRLDLPSLAQATGSRVDYETLTNQTTRIRLHGPTSWTFDSASGTADELEILPHLNTYTARGHAQLTLLPPSDPSDPSDPPPILVDATEIISRPGRVEFTGPVHARQAGKLNLTTDHLTAEFDPQAPESPASLHRLQAQGASAAIIQTSTDPIEVRGESILYNVGEHPQIEVTGSPTWATRGYHGTGDRFLIHPQLPAFEILGAVQASWTSATATNDPPISLSSHHLMFEDHTIRLQGQVVVARNPWKVQAEEMDLDLSNQSALEEIRARTNVVLTFQPRRGTPPPAATTTTETANNLFSGLLREITEAAQQWTLRAQQVVARLDATATDITHLDARGDLDIQHPAVQARSDRLTFDHPSPFLRLEGNPQLETVTGMRIVGAPQSALALDPATGIFRVEGPVRQMTLPSRSLTLPAAQP